MTVTNDPAGGFERQTNETHSLAHWSHWRNTNTRQSGVICLSRTKCTEK
jgi:hypothetical protein